MYLSFPLITIYISQNSLQYQPPNKTLLGLEPHPKDYKSDNQY